MAQIFWPFDPKTVQEWPGASELAMRPTHFGTDWPVPQGTPLRATASGVVDIIWDDGLGAWVIDIHCPDGTVVRNGHLSAMYPIDGAWVNAGQIIGATGGRPGTLGAGMSTGDHFHWEIRNNNGWGDWGWYDPRDLTIHSFAEATKAPAPSKPTIHGMESEMIAYYPHALGKGKPGWLVMGYTPKPLIVPTQREANVWAARIGKATIIASYTEFRRYLRAAGGSAVKLAAVVKG